MLTASLTLLRDGSWGARVLGTPSIGAAIEVRAASGKSWSSRVASIVRAAGAPGESSLITTTTTPFRAI